MSDKVVASELLSIAYKIGIISEESYNEYVSNWRHINCFRTFICKFAPEVYICGGISEAKFINILEMFEGLELQTMWINLPYKFKSHPDIIRKLPCIEHYNLPTQRTHFDRPLPLIKNCLLCSTNDYIVEHFKKEKLF